MGEDIGASARVSDLLQSARDLNAKYGVPPRSSAAAVMFDLKSAATAAARRRQIKLDGADDELLADLMDLLCRIVSMEACDYGPIVDGAPRSIPSAASVLDVARISLSYGDVVHAADCLATLICVTQGAFYSETELVAHYDALAAEETSLVSCSGIAQYYEPRLWMALAPIVLDPA